MFRSILQGFVIYFTLFTAFVTETGWNLSTLLHLLYANFHKGKPSIAFEPMRRRIINLMAQIEGDQLILCHKAYFDVNMNSDGCWKFVDHNFPSAWKKS